MSPKARSLAERFTAFNNEVMAFVENCSDQDWAKVCSGEGWSVGVVARHIAGGHYGALGLAKMIVDGKALPPLTGEAIDKANAQHAQQHVGCTQDEVLGILRKNGSSIVSYISALRDVDLDRTGHLSLIGGDMSAQGFIENVIIASGGEHLASMKAATGK